MQPGSQLLAACLRSAEAAHCISFISPPAAAVASGAEGGTTAGVEGCFLALACFLGAGRPVSTSSSSAMSAGCGPLPHEPGWWLGKGWDGWVRECVSAVVLINPKAKGKGKEWVAAANHPSFLL